MGVIFERMEDALDRIERDISVLNECAESGWVPDPDKTMELARKLLEAADRFRRNKETHQESELDFL